MISSQQLNKISDWEWEVSVSIRKGMNAHAFLISSREIKDNNNDA